MSFGIIVVGFATACGPVDENRSQTVEVDAILELDNEVHTAVEAQDIEGLMEFWADDALIMAPNMPAVEGKAAVRFFFENAFSAMSLEFDRSSVELVVSGDLAIHRGHTVATYTPTEQAPIEDPQKWVDVYRRQQNGRWLISLTIWNSDLPAEVAVFSSENAQ